LLVTVTNRLILEIEIVHDLSCHPIEYVTNAHEHKIAQQVNNS